MKSNKSLNKIVLISSFTTVIIIILAVSTVRGYTTAEKYRQNLEYSYTRALEELSEYTSNIETTLIKNLYVNTPNQKKKIISKLNAESNGAKSALSQLPIYEVRLDNVNKFISQVGDYSVSFSSEDGNKNLKNLIEYSKKINQDLKDILSELNNGTFKIGESIEAINKFSNLTQSDKEPSINSGFKNLEESFVDYPTLIYDGPFSDHILRKTPKLLEDSKEISKTEAKKIASDFLNKDISNVEVNEDISGNMPCYSFSVDQSNISVTKNGGYVNYMLNSRDVLDNLLSSEEAIEKAVNFLDQHHFLNMKERYFFISNGICTINFAYEQKGIICYSDLIKVGISLDKGDIVSFQATGYIMNHTKRENAEDIISQEEAQKNLSSNLNVENVLLAYSPTEGLNEVLCYEFECRGENDDKLLVYINAKTGMEEQIFILLRLDGGTLTL